MFQFKKKFGQNFLINQFIINSITDCFLNFSEVIEIGPGHGALTRSFIDKNIAVTAIDIDLECIESLRDLNINLVHADILQYDLSDSLPVVGNLPYNISSKVVEKIVRNTVPYAVFMFQKELADVLTGLDYGRLTVFAQSRYRITKFMDVKPGNFMPIPQVNSQILIFESIKDYQNVNLDILDHILFLLFSHRRKMIRHIAKKHPILLAQIERMGIDTSLRAQDLSKELYYELVLNFCNSSDKLPAEKQIKGF